MPKPFGVRSYGPKTALNSSGKKHIFGFAVLTESERPLLPSSIPESFTVSLVTFRTHNGFVAHMIGTKLAHYKITGHLGSGGMGDVYQATDSKLGRSVAIKLLPGEFTHDTDRASRFEREARVLASLNHPNIAAIHGIEESDGRKFLVMELVPEKRWRTGSSGVGFHWKSHWGIATQIAEALEAAHEKGRHPPGSQAGEHQGHA